MRVADIFQGRTYVNNEGRFGRVVQRNESGARQYLVWTVNGEKYWRACDIVRAAGPVELKAARANGLAPKRPEW